MSQIALYVLLHYCAANCQPERLPAEMGALVFTSLEDCQAVGKQLDEFNEKAQYFENGKPAPHQTGWHSVCARSYFADYGQTERLTDGRVTCSYISRIPESVMARRLDPYEPRQHCKAPKSSERKP